MPNDEELAELLFQESELFAKEDDGRNLKVDSTVRTVFDRYPGNQDLQHVIERVGILYSLYGPFPGFESRVGVFEMVKHIQKESTTIDEALKLGSEQAFSTIKSVSGREKSGEWSFASKYCYFSKPDRYAIFDSRAESTVLWLRALRKIRSISNSSDYNYEAWRKAVSECIQLSKGKLNSFKEIDQALYEIGRLPLFVAGNKARPVEEVLKMAGKDVHLGI